MAEFKASHIYAYHVTSHDLIKVGYGDNPKSRLSSYCSAYGVAADISSLRTWNFPAPGVASAIEGAIHTALEDAGFEKYILSADGQEAQELFELGNHSYHDALVIVAEAIEDSTRTLMDGLKSKVRAAIAERDRQRRDEIRREKAEEKRQTEESRRVRENAQRQIMTARAKAGWNSEVQPWCNALQRAKALMENKSTVTGLVSFLSRRDTVDELRHRDIYPTILKLVEEVFHLTRRARAWRLRLTLEFGQDVRPDGIDLQFPGGWYLPGDSLHEHIEQESITEVRLAVQAVTGWGGDDALALMKRDPSAFRRLIDFSKNTPSPERASGKTWCKYTTKGMYAKD